MALKLSRPAALTLICAGLSLAWHAFFLPVNQAAYTDGILQIDMFRQGVSFWPPLYALLSRLLAWVPGLGLEGSARLVSLLAGSLAIFPLAAVARRLFGARAALWAMIVWIASPMALRWSLQVMTDMTATALMTGSLAALLVAVEAYLPGLFPRESGAPELPRPSLGNQWLVLGSILGLLATLTRYQGALLLPPFVVAVWGLGRMHRAMPGRSYHPALTLWPWLFLPAWLLGNIQPILNHAHQISQRNPIGNLGQTLIGKVYFAESFVLVSPYFMTYGLFGFMLYGLFRIQWSTARLRWTGWVALYLTAVLIVLHAVFSAFQSRYLLPLLPFACIFAGHGLAVWQRRVEQRKWLLWALAAPAAGWGLIFSALVGIWQGNPFGDLKAAGEAIRAMNLPDSARIYSNEQYNEKIHGAKLKFWSGRYEGVLPIDPSALGQLRPGDLIVLTSAYGGFQTYQSFCASLSRHAPVQRLGKPFRRLAYPLLPDIMEEPGTHPNPMAWQLRYQPQTFETAIFRVEGNAAVEPPPEPRPQPPQATPSAAEQQLKQILQEREALQKNADGK